MAITATGTPYTVGTGCCGCGGTIGGCALCSCLAPCYLWTWAGLPTGTYTDPNVTASATRVTAGSLSSWNPTGYPAINCGAGFDYLTTSLVCGFPAETNSSAGIQVVRYGLPLQPGDANCAPLDDPSVICYVKHYLQVSRSFATADLPKAGETGTYSVNWTRFRARYRATSPGYCSSQIGSDVDSVFVDSGTASLTIEGRNLPCPSVSAPEGMSAASGEAVGLHARPSRTLPCVYLGGRTERKAGCGGFGCRHECDSGRPDVAEHLAGQDPPGTTVPAGPCQTCPGYEADPFRQWG